MLPAATLSWPSPTGGETERSWLLEALKRLEMRLVTLTGKIQSTLAEASDVVLDVA